MYVLIVEKRISSEVSLEDAHAEDWYVLLAIALPFEPTTTIEIQTKVREPIQLERVVYNPDDGTFWAKTKGVLRAKPDAGTYAAKFVKSFGWDSWAKASELEEAKETLAKMAVKKLQRAIMRVHPGVIQGPINLAFDPRGKGGRH